MEKERREADYFGRPFNTYSALLAFQAAAISLMGDFKEAEEQCEKALRFVRTIDNRYALTMVEWSYGSVYVTKGDGKRALEHLREALQHYEAAQFFHFSGLTCSMLGMAHGYVGEMEEARLYLERAIKCHTEVAMPSHMSLACCCLGMVHFFSGDLLKAQSSAEEAVRLAQQNSEKVYEGFSWLVLGAVLGASDPSNTTKAEECLLKGIAMEEEIGVKAFSCLGHFFLGQHYASSGQREKALEHLAAARAMFQEMGMGFWLTLSQSSLDSLSK